MQAPRIHRAFDDNKQPVVRVEIVGRLGVFVTLDAPDYDDLVATQGPLRLHLNRNRVAGTSYVKIRQPNVIGRKTILSRVISKASKGRVVRYRNHDRLDLRQSNLTIEPGPARGTTPRMVEASAQAYPA